MAYFHYDRYRKKKENGSVIRVSYEKKANVYKSEYFGLPDEFRYIVRFSFVVLDAEKGIRERNKILRDLINKKADRAHIPMSGARFITIHNHGHIVYNIVLDKLLSAVWLFTQLTDTSSLKRFSYIKKEKRTQEEKVQVFNKLRDNLYREVSKIFRDNKGVTAVEVNSIGLYIDQTGREHQDFDPINMPIYYTGKPRYRAYQPFGRLSGNHKPTLK